MYKTARPSLEREREQSSKRINKKTKHNKNNVKCQKLFKKKKKREEAYKSQVNKKRKLLQSFLDEKEEGLFHRHPRDATKPNLNYLDGMNLCSSILLHAASRLILLRSGSQGCCL